MYCRNKSKQMAFSLSDGFDEKQQKDAIYEGKQHENGHGINWWVTGLFIVGEMAGGGLIAMPTALINAS